MTATDTTLPFLFHERADAPGPGSCERRMLFVHAHPDDESSKGAGTAARFADEGHGVTLVTLTDGAQGEVLNAAAGEVAPEDMVAVREVELTNAVEIIGFHRTYQLGYPDSGWFEDLSQVPEGRFWTVPLDEASARLATIYRRERPQVVATYTADGGYPHPDHIRCHQVSMRAMELAADPDAADVDGEPWQVGRMVAVNVFTRQKLLALHSCHLDAGLPSPFADWLKRRRPGWPITFHVDVCDHLGRRDDALLAHVTQVAPDGFWFQTSRELEAAVCPNESYVLIAGDPPARVPSTDLFEGLV